MYGTKWTEYETRVMLQHYVTGGPAAVMALLPHRSAKQISQKAWQMEIQHKPHLAGRRNGGRRRKADTQCAPYPWPPLSNLDRLGMKLWGFAANTDQPLRPMVRVELEAA
jgi:hypothetical protein